MTTANSALAQSELHEARIIPKICSDLSLTLLISPNPYCHPDNHSAVKISQPFQSGSLGFEPKSSSVTLYASSFLRLFRFFHMTLVK